MDPTNVLLEFMKEKGFISEKQYKDCSSFEGDPCEYALKRRYITRKKYETILESFHQKETLKTQPKSSQLLSPENEDGFSDLEEALPSKPKKVPAKTPLSKVIPSKIAPAKAQPDSSVFPSQKDEDSSNSFSSEIFFDPIKQEPASPKKGEISGSLSVEIVSNIREQSLPNSKNSSPIPSESSADLLEELSDFEMEDFSEMDSSPSKKTPPTKKNDPQDSTEFAEILESDDLIETLDNPQDSTEFAEILESDDLIETLDNPQDSTEFAEILESDSSILSDLKDPGEVFGSEDDLAQTFSDEVFKKGFSNGDKGFTTNESLEFEFLGTDDSLVPPEDSAEFGIVEEANEDFSMKEAEVFKSEGNKKAPAKATSAQEEQVQDFFGSDEIDLEITSSNAFLDPLSGDANPTLPQEASKAPVSPIPVINTTKNKITKNLKPSSKDSVSSEIAAFTDFDSIDLSEFNEEQVQTLEESEEIIDAPVVSEEEVARRKAKGMKIFEGEYVDAEEESEPNIQLDGDSSVPAPLPVSKTSPFIEAVSNTIDESFEEMNDFSFLDEISPNDPSQKKPASTTPDLNLEDLDEMDFSDFGDVGDISAAVDELETLADVVPSIPVSKASKIPQKTPSAPLTKKTPSAPLTKKTPSAPLTKKTPSAPLTKKTPSAPLTKKTPVTSTPFEADPATGSLDHFFEGIDLELPSPEEDFPSFDDFESSDN